MSGPVQSTDFFRQPLAEMIDLRHPLAVARSLVTLGRLSGGRVEAGVGAGWLVDEFTVVGLPPEGRSFIPMIR